MPPKQRKRKSQQKPEGIDFRPYIRRILKTVNPNRTIGMEAIKTISDMTNNFYERIVNEVPSLAQAKETLTEREIIFAIQLTLKDELKKHAVSQAHKALSLYDLSTGRVAQPKRKKATV